MTIPEARNKIVTRLLENRRLLEDSYWESRGAKPAKAIPHFLAPILDPILEDLVRSAEPTFGLLRAPLKETPV